MKVLSFRLLLILLSGISFFHCTGQQVFNKRYTLKSYSSAISGALPYNGRYYSSATALDSSNYSGGGHFLNHWGVRLTVYDLNGEIVRDTIYQRSDKHFIETKSNQLNVMPDGTFLLAANTIDTSHLSGKNKTTACLIQFDSLGNVLQFRDYDRPSCNPSDPNHYVLEDFKPDVYGNWLMLSSMICSGNMVFSLRKVDHSFNEIWVKNFTVSSNNNIPKHLLIENDGYVMSGGTDNGNTKPHADYYTSLLIKCDTAGNKLWTWENAYDTNGKIQYCINDIVRTKDGGYLYCGTGEGRPVLTLGKFWIGVSLWGWVQKLDAARNPVWQTKLGFIRGGPAYNEQKVIIELPDGNYMIGGRTFKPDEPVEPFLGMGEVSALLAKINGGDGSVIWQRYYQCAPDSLAGYINDIRQTPDGGFILAGGRDINPVADTTIKCSWLIKVDSNGCEGPGDPQCWPLGISRTREFRGGFSIYPNPSNGSLTITTPHAVILTKEGSLNAVVYDLLGRLVFEKEISFANNKASIDLNLTDGIYIVELKDAEGNASRQRIEVRN